MPARHDEGMTRRYGLQVHERNDLVVLMDHASFRSASNDGAEDAIIRLVEFVFNQGHSRFPRRVR